MNELSRIQFQTTQDYSNYISGRLLHRALEIKTPYRKWFPRVCAQNDYEEGVDFVTSDKIVRRADGVPMPHDLHDHLITADVAKEICLAQHTAIGKLLRKKLIAQEKAALEARELELQSCQNQLARTVQQNEELSASLAVQKANMEAMGDLIERANTALILQRDALHRQTRQMDRLSRKISHQEKSIQKMTPKADYYVADALDIYVNGSLNLFNHHTNVDIKNRVVCFDIKDLGTQLKKMGMLIVQEMVWNRLAANRDSGKYTRYYMDEFHILLKEPQTAAYSVQIWKRFRKWGGIPTGITQNIKDLTGQQGTDNILDNTSFIYMLSQAPGDRKALTEHLNLSPHQLSHVTNVGSGEGLLFFGNTIIPFEDHFPKDTEMYKLLTTKPSEVQQRKEEENNE